MCHRGGGGFISRPVSRDLYMLHLAQPHTIAPSFQYAPLAHTIAPSFLCAPLAHTIAPSFLCASLAHTIAPSFLCASLARPIAPSFPYGSLAHPIAIHLYASHHDRRVNVPTASSQPPIRFPTLRFGWATLHIALRVRPSSPARGGPRPRCVARDCNTLRFGPGFSFLRAAKALGQRRLLGNVEGS